MPDPLPVWTFASGVKLPGDMAGYARAGIPFGTTVLGAEDGQWKWRCALRPDARPSARSCYLGVVRISREHDSPVFVDSGAYSEAKGDAPPIEQWEEILEVMRELAAALGSNALLVFPDKVGDQAATLARLREHKETLREIVEHGAVPIVAYQPGKLGPVAYHEAVSAILGNDAWVMGWPVRNPDNTPERVRGDVLALVSAGRTPWGVHLLGLGPRSPSWDAYMHALAPLPSSTWVSTDAVFRRGMVGRAEGVRPLTAAEDEVGAALVEGAWRGVSDPVVGESLDPTSIIEDVEGWMQRQQAEALARDARNDPNSSLTQDEVAALRRGEVSEAWASVLERDDHLAQLWLESAIENAWRERLPRISTQLRRAGAIERVYGAADEVAPVAVSRRAQLDLFGSWTDPLGPPSPASSSAPEGDPGLVVSDASSAVAALRHPAVLDQHAKSLNRPPEHAVAVLVPCSDDKPYRTSPSHAYGYGPALEGNAVDVWVVSDLLGFVPLESDDTYPANAYQFAPKYLTGEARKILLSRMAEWIDTRALDYAQIYLALPAHHAKLVRAATKLAEADPAYRDVSITACRASGACPKTDFRPSSKAYRAYLRRMIGDG